MERKKHNSGVALIMVLGLLTVMVLMAVTFAITMRTERLAAGNYADTVRARELIHVGIVRAMNDLAVNLGPTGLYSKIGGVPVGKVYPDWNVTNSYYTNTPAARWNYTNALIQRSATNYIPRALWTEATNADRSISLSPSHHWLPVESLIYTNDGVGGPNCLAESNLMGRVAYLILNCSGLLDANYVGGIPRASGTNPAEIAITNLCDVTNLTYRFTEDRRTNSIRFETLAQLNSEGKIYAPATNLFIYSRGLPGYWTNANPPYVGTQVNLSGSASDLTNRMSDIMNAFACADFTTYESGVLYSNLIDYVDADSVPFNSNFEYCVESVPMINEIRVDVKVTENVSGPSKRYLINPGDGKINIECWYPFEVNFTNPVKIHCDVTFGTDPSDIFGTLLPALSPDYVYTPPSAGISAGEFVPSHTFDFSLGPGDWISTPFPTTIKLISTNFVKIIKNDTGEIVDQLLAPIVLTNICSVGVLMTADAECLDPRFNANTAPNQWQQMGNTNDASYGFENTWTKSYLDFLNNDGDWHMYVGNRQLRSVGELGYLVYSPSAPWKTVKLYGPTCHRVLDVFGLSINTNDEFMTNMVYRGRVNCNPNVAPDATAVVFAGMPVDQYPGGPSNTVHMLEAQAFVSRLFTKGICTNLSDIGRNLNLGDFTFPAGINELQKEAYFRNAFNLLNLRQNVFTILIEAQAASGGNIPRNPAKQRAVVIVWRDPYTGEMFKRHIIWLGD